jgi:FAD-linked sulfhydryl oxidase
MLPQFIISSLSFFHPRARAYFDPWTGDLFGEGGVEKQLQRDARPAKITPGVEEGGVIMPKLENATAK